MPTFPAIRMQRLRRTPAIRAMLCEHRVQLSDLICPVFVRHGAGEPTAIASMPGYFQYSVAHLSQHIKDLVAAGIRSVIVFGIPAMKDAQASDASSATGIVAQAIREIKSAAPDVWVIADVCCCAYMDHGHCGVVQQQNGHGHIDNDATLVLLQQQAVNFAAAGADCMAPSGMMDGMVQAVRSALDAQSYHAVAIMSYAVKYASAFYGPFRDASQGAPQYGDRRGYQMDVANGQEALREAALDVAEGCDLLMVKPGLSCLDVIARVSQQYPSIPMVAYQVSGEYAMIKAAAAQGWLDERAAVFESLVAMKRAGASLLISYFAWPVARWLASTE